MGSDLNNLSVCGVDEVGRGPLAGPVVAAAVSYPNNYKNKNFKDSKQISKKNLDKLSEEIKNTALNWAIVSVSHILIDALNIRRATWLSMSLAANLVKADLYLIDGNMTIDVNKKQKCIVKGDASIIQISAASIIAKQWRDAFMKNAAKKYPLYEFEKNVGYPTKKHKKAIASFGICPLHRKTFSGVKEFYQNNKVISSFKNTIFAICKENQKGFYIPQYNWPIWRNYNKKTPYQKQLFYN